MDLAKRTVHLADKGAIIKAAFLNNSQHIAIEFPAIFRWALCMSGRYDTSWLTDGCHNEAVYFNNPVAYVPNLDGEHLQRVRDNTHLVLVCGQGKHEALMRIYRGEPLPAAGIENCDWYVDAAAWKGEVTGP